jgi:putative flavoprotein involved in K+ transport
VPGLVDAQGFPVHDDGESTVSPGLHFVGVHFLRRRRSSLLFGVGDDATATATRIASVV